MRGKQLLSHRFIPVSILSFLSIAPPGSAAPDIIGGITVPAMRTESLSTVAVLTETPRGVGICTGSLIASDILVTAAHCVTDPFGKAAPADQISVVFDLDIKNPGADKRKALGVMPHSKYAGMFSKGSDQNDIALVRFPGGTPAGYRPASVLSSKVKLKKGTNTTLLGYGVNFQNPLIGGTGAGVLRQVDVKVHSPVLGSTEVILDQTQGKGACHGDSGGPAMVKIGKKTYLWGVTNRGYPDTAPDDCAHYSVYTRISAHLKFVNASIKVLRKIQ